LLDFLVVGNVTWIGHRDFLDLADDSKPIDAIRTG
jgi:hypothetical protein